MNMKLLSENMLRFGTKNLSEGSRRNLTLESIMQTIHENGLRTAVMNRLLTEDSNLDPSIKTGIETQITAFNAAYKKFNATGKFYLQIYDNSASPQAGGSDETYILGINAYASGVPGSIRVGEVTATQDRNGTIFDKTLRVYGKVDEQIGLAKIGQQYANDPALTTEPDSNKIQKKLTQMATSNYAAYDDGKFRDFMQGNGQQYLIDAFLIAFRAIQVYPTSTRENKNTSLGPQTTTGGKPKGVNPYLKKS